ncbi:MAG: DUF2500 family protein [Armatimonadetes bacterium]|nr:DUF2500 family protein [Armatimonadota bacterium]
MLEAWLIMVFIITIIAAAALVAIFVFGYDIFWLVRNWLSPTVRVPAKVLRKTHKQWDVSIVGETPEMQAARLGLLGRDRESAAKALNKLAATQDVPELILYQGTDCYITFDVNGAEMEFIVPMPTYIDTEEGTEGLLVYKGERFKRFIAGVK